jgi:tRNA G18 (ribose-2'-O)-methylase SpoU
MDICDFFVYIPQYGAGTGSLNVTVAASIVLHHFAGVFFQIHLNALKHVV